MGMILTGIVVAIAIAIGAGYFMNSEQRPSWEVYSTPVPAWETRATIS